MLLQTQIPVRPEVNRHAPLSPHLWSSYMDQEGRVVRVAELKETVFKGVRYDVLICYS